MKRILIALAVLLAAQVADAQVKTPEAAKKAVESAKAAAENPKKAAKVATWTKLAKAYMDAYDAPTGNLLLNTPRIQLEQMMGLKKALSVEEVVVEGTPFKKETHADKVLYFAFIIATLNSMIWMPCWNKSPATTPRLPRLTPR